MATDNSIQRELREMAPGLAGLPPVNPFSLPEGYFDSLPQLVMIRIKTEQADSVEEEIMILAPSLSGLNKKPTFSMPEGYFEQLQAKTMQNVENRTQAKVVSMPAGRRFVRYAAAAVVAGILATGAWFFIGQAGNRAGMGPVAQTNDSSVDRQMQAQANGLSEKEMMNYLDGNLSIAGIESSEAKADIQQDDIKILLADISDQELQHFLDHDDPRSEKLN
jgi:hypothetical protein